MRITTGPEFWDTLCFVPVDSGRKYLDVCRSAAYDEAG